jgi:MFS family permease
LPPLLPLLAVVIVATALPALMQSALPLDLVRGGLRRPPFPDSLGALLMGLQLGLMVLLQWPVGQAMARRPVWIGLGLSLVCFVAGTLLLALSALSDRGFALLVAAQVPLALGAAAFLPTATEAVVELTPPLHRGLAMALFSQCFAVSAVLAPPLAGELMRRQGHALLVWLLMAGGCLAGLALVAQLARQQRRPVLRVLSGQEPAGGQGLLYRVTPPGGEEAAAEPGGDGAAAAGTAKGAPTEPG